MNNNNHPTLSEGTSEKCPGKAIYTELNYEKLRQNRMKELDTYYQKVLDKYEQNKREYNQQFQNTAKEANNVAAEFEEKTGPDATPDQIQEGEATIKPTIIRLNKQLLQIATNVLNDNEHTGKSLMQQYQDLKKQEVELNKLMNNVSKLEDELNMEENKQLTRDARMKTSYEVNQNSYYWYTGLVVVNFLLIMFLIIYTVLILQAK
jgi:hypothetical protein